MNNATNSAYTFSMATWEIISLLLLAFIIGTLLCWILRAMGICCRKKPPEIRPVTAPVISVETKRTDPLDIKPTHIDISPLRTNTRLHSNFDLPKVDLPVPALDIELPKVEVQAPALDIDLPDIDPPKIDLPELDVKAPALDIDLPDIELPKVEVSAPAFDIDLPDIDLPNVDLPELDVKAPQFEFSGIDPHKPIINPPDLDIIDVDMPHIEPDLPDVDVKTSSMDVNLPAMDVKAPTLDVSDIDPHKPIVNPPDMDDIDINVATPATNTVGNVLGDWLHKAKESVEHLTEKATPATSEWLHKAKENVEHLTEKATPATSEWLHKAKESMEHLTEKATPATNEWLHKAKESMEHLTEKATPATNEWLHKAKEIGSGLTSKGNAIGSETLVKGSSTLAALAASAKELTEKLANNFTMQHDDLQKLKGIGPTFAAVLHRAGINTYQQLAETSTQKLHALLIVEDEQFSQHDTSSWAHQAELAAQGEWERLQAYQDSL